MKNPLVSVAIPVVKPQFLKQTIQSCLDQTYSKIEVIIQSNAKDSVVKREIRDIVEGFEDDRIRFFETVYQLPMIDNWNSLLSKAVGDLFTILCDDDFWHIDFIKELITLSLKYPKVDVFHTRVVFTSESGKYLALSQNCPEYEEGLDFIYHRVAGHRSTFLSDFIVRRKALLNLGGFISLPDGWGSDDLTWFSLVLKSGVCFCQRPLFNYRVSNANTTHNNNYYNKLSAIDLQYRYIKNLIERADIDKNDIRYQMIKSNLIKFRGNRKVHFYEKRLVSYWMINRFIAKVIAMAWLYAFRQKEERQVDM